MKAKLIAAAVAASLWGGAALADQAPAVKTEVQTQATTPSSDTWRDPNTAVDQQTTTTTTVTTPDTTAAMPNDQYKDTRVGLRDDDMYKKNDNLNHVRGVTVLVGGGVEGYTGALASQLQAGPTYGATLALKPTKVLGLELGYTGATNEIARGNTGTTFSAGEARGPDIVRNGGRALVSVGLTASAIQPYIVGGVGIDRYNVRASDAAFHSDTTGNVPVGAGLRTHIRGFTADARVTQALLFNNDFASQVESRQVVGVNSINAGRYQGTLSLGASF